jgi:IAA-amino acid hydrolase
VLLVFQPAEEGGAAADIMIKEGAVEGAGAAFALHVMPTVDVGLVATRPGTIMAGAYSFEITLAGRGGHAALPHLNVDPVVAAAALVGALQTLVSRETSPLGSAVLSITTLSAGSGAFNVIPDNARLAGTLRALTHEHIEALRGRIASMAAAVAAAYGCTASVDWREDIQPYYPPTVNDPAAAAFAARVASGLLGAASVRETEPLMAGEDFAFFGRAVPAAMLFLGVRNAALNATANLHSPQFRVDEAALPLGAALHAALAVEYLAGGGAFFDGAVSGGGVARDEL